MLKYRKRYCLILILIACQLHVFSQEITLDTLINSALKYNPLVKGGKINVEISEYEINIAKSYKRPTVSTNTVSSLSNQYNIGNNYSLFETGINANQVIWQKGKNNALVKQYEYISEARQNDLEAIKQDISLSVKIAYYNLLRYDNLYRISIFNTEQSQLLLSAAEEKYALGIGRNSDILKAESELANSKYQSKNYSFLLEETKIELCKLTGIVLSEMSIDCNQSKLEVVNNEMFLADSLFAIAVKNYPELLSIENILNSQEFYQKSIESSLYPSISANTGYNLYYNPVNNSQGFWNAGLTVRWNIFEGNRRKNQIGIEQLKSLYIQIQKEDLLLELKQEVENTINALYNARDKIEISIVLIKSTKENLEMLNAEYKEGLSSMLELSNAQSDNFLAKEKYINALADYALILAKLERLLGIININK